MRSIRRAAPPIAAALAVISVGGCSSKAGPEFLSIDAANYQAAFDAATEAAREDGMPPAMRNRRGGVIETFPAYAASLMEPWGFKSADPSQSIENTINFNRRRARFEFTPITLPQGPGESRIVGPDLLAVDTPAVDLTAYEGPLELRVWVYIEQQHRPGVQRFAWTRRSTNRTRRIVPKEEGESLPGTYWTPSARDKAFERRLLAAIRDELALVASDDAPKPADG